MLLDRMVNPFTAKDLEKEVIKIGYQKSGDVSMRIADRLIQKYKKGGYILFGSDRKWRVLPRK